MTAKSFSDSQSRLLAYKVTVQVNVQNEPEITPDLSLRAKRSNLQDTLAVNGGDCFVAPLLAMTPLNGYAKSRHRSPGRAHVTEPDQDGAGGVLHFAGNSLKVRGGLFEAVS